MCLDIPVMGSCGLLVDGEVSHASRTKLFLAQLILVHDLSSLQLQYHKQGQIIVFDDSKPHRAFNLSESESRTVLIVDLVRPDYIPLGTASGQHTPELDGFVALFK